jgi:hypothetical protein
LLLSLVTLFVRISVDVVAATAVLKAISRLRVNCGGLTTTGRA